VAPEQVLGDVADAQADVFVVGMLAHELLRNRSAFNDLAVIGDADDVLSQTPEPIDRVAGHLKTSLVSLINRCLEKRPEDRYQDMHEVEQQLAVIRRAVLKHEESATGAAGWSGLLKAILHLLHVLGWGLVARYRVGAPTRMGTGTPAARRAVTVRTKKYWAQKRKAAKG
jgi:serine/threonine protein kinase